MWDVALNSLYCYDCERLGQIAEILHRKEAAELKERAEQLKARIPRLWNDALGIYCNYKTDRKQFSEVLTPCNFYALLTGIPTETQVRRMMEEHFRNPYEFWGKWLLPSVSRSHPMYHENNYWRGRIWAPLNFLVYMGMRRYPNLKERELLVKNSLDLFMQGGQSIGMYTRITAVSTDMEMMCKTAIEITPGEDCWHSCRSWRMACFIEMAF